jgi:hypothetical protein
MAHTIPGSAAADKHIVDFAGSLPSIDTGSQDAADALTEIAKPLVGAVEPAAMTTAQLNVKWSATDPTGIIKDTPFPTPQ